MLNVPKINVPKKNFNLGTFFRHIFFQNIEPTALSEVENVSCIYICFCFMNGGYLKQCLFIETRNLILKSFFQQIQFVNWIKTLFLSYLSSAVQNAVTKDFVLLKLSFCPKPNSKIIFMMMRIQFGNWLKFVNVFKE